MNFQGRYWTLNGTLVAVHPVLQVVGGIVKWRGHELRLKSPYTDNRVFYWDGGGKCKMVFGSAEGTSKFDLMRKVNPQTKESEVECVDCAECREDRRGHGSGPLPGKHVTVVQTGDKTLFITEKKSEPQS